MSFRTNRISPFGTGYPAAQGFLRPQLDTSGYVEKLRDQFVPLGRSWGISRKHYETPLLYIQVFNRCSQDKINAEYRVDRLRQWLAVVEATASTTPLGLSRTNTFWLEFSITRYRIIEHIHSRLAAIPGTSEYAPMERQRLAEERESQQFDRLAEAWSISRSSHNPLSFIKKIHDESLRIIPRENRPEALRSWSAEVHQISPLCPRDLGSKDLFWTQFSSARHTILSRISTQLEKIPGTPEYQKKQAAIKKEHAPFVAILSQFALLSSQWGINTCWFPIYRGSKFTATEYRRGFSDYLKELKEIGLKAIKAQQDPTILNQWQTECDQLTASHPEGLSKENDFWTQYTTLKISFSRTVKDQLEYGRLNICSAKKINESMSNGKKNMKQDNWLTIFNMTGLET